MSRCNWNLLFQWNADFLNLFAATGQVQCKSSWIFKSQQDHYFFLEDQRLKNKTIGDAHHCIEGQSFFKPWRKCVSNSCFLYHIKSCIFFMTQEQGVTKKCRLSWLTNSALVYEPKWGERGWVARSRIWAQMKGEGVSCGVSANEYSCTQEPK